MSIITRFVKEESGATAIEYGLIASLIAVAAIIGMGRVGNSVNATFARVSTALDNNRR